MHPWSGPLCYRRRRNAHAFSMTAASATSAERPRAPRDLFGHPRGIGLSVRDRDVGALLLLRHARAARALHDQIFAVAGAGRPRARAGLVQKRARSRIRPAGDAALRLADLRFLHRARLSDADLRRALGRPRARPAPHRHPRRSIDGGRPFHDGLRAFVPAGADAAHSRQWLLQAEHFHASRPALRARRPPPRPRLLDLLCRHQSRRVLLAAGVRHAGRGLRLALRFCRRRRRHDHRPRHLSPGRHRRCRETPSPNARRRRNRSAAAIGGRSAPSSC